MRGWTDNFGGGAQVLLGLSLALAGTAAFTLLALLGGYLLALLAVALILLAPIALAELEFHEKTAEPGSEAPPAPEVPGHPPVTIPEVPAQLPGSAGNFGIRRVA
jgi:uncharacterized protein (DUF58 family)